MRMRMISYAPNREDVLLLRAFGDHVGFYVDVGANDPLNGSTTRALYERGWRGINVEPNPALHERLVSERPDDVNVRAVISSKSGSLPFHIVEDDPALSTLDQAIAAGYLAKGRPVERIDVQAMTLDTLLESYAAVRTIDLLKIDVEGAEQAVLSGIDLSRWRPRVLVIEAVAPCRFEKTHSDWEGLVTVHGYRLSLFDGVNRIYVRPGEDALGEALSWPVCSLDHYATLESLELAEYRKFGRLARTVARGTQNALRSAKRITHRG